MTGESFPDPFAGHPEWELEPPRPIVPTPATMSGQLRGRRVLIGLPGHGWRGDLRADEKVVQGSRTFVPVMSEGEWYRAEAEQTEIFAPLVPVERVWVEEYGVAGISHPADDITSRLVSLDEPARRTPVAALDAATLSGRRVVQAAGRRWRGTRPSRGDRASHKRSGRGLRARHQGSRLVSMGLEWPRATNTRSGRSPALDRVRSRRPASHRRLASRPGPPS